MADLNDGRVELPRSRPRFVAFSASRRSCSSSRWAAAFFQLQVVNGEMYAEPPAADRTVEVRSARRAA